MLTSNWSVRYIKSIYQKMSNQVTTLRSSRRFSAYTSRPQNWHPCQLLSISWRSYHSKCTRCTYTTLTILLHIFVLLDRKTLQCISFILMGKKLFSLCGSATNFLERCTVKLPSGHCHLSEQFHSTSHTREHVGFYFDMIEPVPPDISDYNNQIFVWLEQPFTEQGLPEKYILG